MITESLILVEGTAKQDALKISLMNAKQLVIGSTPSFGTILHVAANSAADLGNAILAISKVPGVTNIFTLALRTPAR